MKVITPKESRQNIELIQRVIDGEPAEVIERVGVLALAQLADLMPSQEFETFINGAVHHATTGEAPPDQDADEQQSPDQTGLPQPAAGGETQ